MPILPVLPLVFAALLMAHPTGDSFYVIASEHTEAWLVVHVAGAVLFPAMAAVVWQLLRGLTGTAATVGRCALVVFAVFYTAWEVMTGIVTGILAHAGDEQGVDLVTTHWLSGELGVFNSVGSLAWTVAIVAAVVALRATHARRGALVALGAGALMVMHVPPIGPVALICLSGAAYSLGARVPRQSMSFQ